MRSASDEMNRHLRQVLWPALTFLIGMSGILAQTLLWRELLITYCGNELSLGFTLANWLIAEALGALSIVRHPGSRENRPLFAFRWVFLAFCASTCAAMVIARTWRHWVGAPIGHPADLFTLTWTSLLALFGPAYFHGALFPLAANLHGCISTAASADSVRRTYVWETVGTLAGGALARTLFYWELSAGAWMVLILFTSATALGLAETLAAPPHQQPTGFRAKTKGVLLASIVLCALGLVPLLDQASQRWEWIPYELLLQRHSTHSTVTVLRHKDELIFCVDGVPTVLGSSADRVELEQRVHVPFVFHPHPTNVLVLGTGLGGLVHEILKHPSVERVDCAEPNQLLVTALKQFPTELVQQEMADPRVSLIPIDGYRFVRETDTCYDIILVTYNEPGTLYANRYFTEEFFLHAAARLNPDGLLVTTVPAPVRVVDTGIRALVATTYRTLHKVFAHTQPLPVESSVTFLAARHPIRKISSKDALYELNQRGLTAVKDLPWYLEQRLHPGRQSWLREYLQDIRAPVNRALRPVALFYLLRHWQHLYAPRAAQLEKLLIKWPITVWLTIAASCLFLASLPFLLRPANSTPRVATLTIATTGFAGMLFDLVLLFTFQSVLGYVHSWVGLLVATYMAGAAISAAWIGRHPLVIRHPTWCLLLLDVLILVFCGVLPLLARMLVAGGFHQWLLFAGFLALSAISGMLTGSQFPVAALLATSQTSVSGVAGRLLAADLLGGWVAGVGGAALMLPLGGVFGTCAIVALLKVWSALLLTIARSATKVS